jgi:hypothetical protein
MRMVVMAHNQLQIGEFVSLGKSLVADIVADKTFECRKGSVKADFPINKKYQRYDLDKINSPDKSHVVWDHRMDYHWLTEAAKA